MAGTMASSLVDYLNPEPLNPRRLSRCIPRKAGSADQGSKKFLDRILKPGKLSGNVGNYEDEAEHIST
jgi:hypothetical protein